MTKKTPHSALRDRAIAQAQPANADVMFEHNVVGKFKRWKPDALEEDDSPPIGVGVPGKLDTSVLIDGAGYAETEWKYGNDTLRPKQRDRIANLTARRIPWIVIHARDAADIDRACAEFTALVTALPRR